MSVLKVVPIYYCYFTLASIVGSSFVYKVCIDTCTDMCIDTCTDMCIDVCIDMVTDAGLLAYHPSSRRCPAPSHAHAYLGVCTVMHRCAMRCIRTRKTTRIPKRVKSILVFLGSWCGDPSRATVIQEVMVPLGLLLIIDPLRLPLIRGQ